MKMHTWIAAAALLLSSTAFAQTPPVAGGGCTPGAHTFCVLNTADAGTGSLRQAIADSNTVGGANTIGFAIPTNPVGPTPQTITLASALPAIDPNGTVTSLTVDGTSQLGSVLNTNAPDQGGLTTKLMIEIVGSNGNGFFYNCCAVPYKTLTFQGLALHGFNTPIFGQTSGFTPKAKFNVYGCFIGTKIDGTALSTQGNSGTAIDPYFDEAQIGGVQPWQRNLISGNSSGISTFGANATVVIEGNLIGTDITGTVPVPNISYGISLNEDWPGTRVGCTGSGCTDAHASSRNVISGNGGLAIHVQTNGTSPGGAQIKGNVIGTDWTGTKPLPNGPAGGNCPSTYCGGIETIGFGSAPALIVGGFNPGEANVIAYNNGPGIWNNPNSATSNTSASFDNRGNVVHGNAGVDVGFQYGWLANDPGDADTGVNNKQNFPVIQSAHVSSGQLIVTYSVDSTTANSSYPLRIDFYVDIDEGSGEFLVSDSYPAASAQAARTVTLALPADAQSPVGFVASATDKNGYSSEFSPSYVFDRIFADRFEGH
ncbi:hypothetical protein [Dokdonella soli]|uniref:Uncharacterized protein n=1 Tax=Dokdonella soli TaxID=529810 RepID=A0ABN1IX85_9GAMM